MVSFDDNDHIMLKETREVNRVSIYKSYGVLTGQFALATACFMWFGLTAKGECATEASSSCVL